MDDFICIISCLVVFMVIIATIFIATIFFTPIFVEQKEHAQAIAILNAYCKSIGFDEIYQTQTCIRYNDSVAEIQQIHCNFEGNIPTKCWKIMEVKA